MADSDFWRSHANQFRALAGQHAVNAFLWAQCNAEGTLTLGGNYSFTTQFSALAARVAPEINSDSVNLIDSWLKALISESPDSLEKSVTRDGVEILSNICAASADYCNALEFLAIESEAKAAVERRRLIDPRSQPELVRELNALESLKKLHTGPAKEIPEAVVRTLIAQRTGIKPEDVPFEQIVFEVTGLFPYFGPKISLIPTPAAVESASLPSPKARTAIRQSSSGEKGEYFPNRALWLTERLRERSWNKHKIQRTSGLNHRTVQKILDGLPVHEDGLDKLVKALNFKLVPGQKKDLTVLDVPND